VATLSEAALHERQVATSFDGKGIYFQRNVFFSFQVWFDNTGYVSMVAYMNVVNNMLFRASLSHDVDPTTAGISVTNHPMNRTHIQMDRYLLYAYVPCFIVHLSQLFQLLDRFVVIVPRI